MQADCPRTELRKIEYLMNGFFEFHLCGFGRGHLERLGRAEDAFAFCSIEIGDREGKAYCGFYLDCHMHTAVTDVRRAKTIGDNTANGEFYIVRVNVFSDAKAATLGLLTVDAHVEDAAGSTYTRDLIAEEALAPQPDFAQQVEPSESFDKEIVFDLPADVDRPKLDIREGYGIDHFIEALLIGDEDSIFHKRSYLKLTK